MDSDSSSDEVVSEFPGFLRVHKDGRVVRLTGTEILPASVDPATGVSSKDIIIDADTSVSARLYLPQRSPENKDGDKQRKKKLPILVYFHGGGFIIESPMSPVYHNYLNSVVARTQIVGVSVHYRRAPEHVLPAAHNDSWAVLQWVAAHATGGPEPLLTERGDFTRFFLAGDSAGANIVHNLAMRAAEESVAGAVEIQGIILTHPFFWGLEPVGSETTDPKQRSVLESLWRIAHPSAVKGVEDPLLNPTAEGAPSLALLACRRVLVCVAEKDILKDRGWHYYKALLDSGWMGVAEMLETEGENHVFHLVNPSSAAAADMMERLAAFLARGRCGL